MKFFIYFLILFPVLAFAELGLFQPQLDPDEVLTGMDKIIKFSAEIGIANKTVEWVKLYEQQLGIETLSEISLLNDKGLNGDERIGDTIYSVELPLRSEKPLKKNFILAVKYRDISKPYRSKNLVLEFVTPIIEADIKVGQKILKELILKCKEFRRQYTIEKTRFHLTEAAKKYKDLVFIWNQKDNPTIEYKGIRFVLLPSDCQTTDGPAVD